MASPQIFEDLSSGFSILLQKKSEHTFLCYPLFQDYLNLLTLVNIYILLLLHNREKEKKEAKRKSYHQFRSGNCIIYYERRF